MIMVSADVQINLSRAEALVIFDLLARLDDTDSIKCEDPAERRVLWKIEGQLEKILTEPLAPNYQELLARARHAMSEHAELLSPARNFAVIQLPGRKFPGVV